MFYSLDILVFLLVFSETIFSLRKKLNALERDKLEAVAASNQEVSTFTYNTSASVLPRSSSPLASD